VSRRDLSEEERALWRGVARSVKPLRKRVARPSDHGEAAAAGAPAKAVKSARPVKAPAKPPTRAPAKAGKFVKLAPPPSKPSAAPVLLPSFAPTLAPLARREKQHLARGRTAIDARIDLHGMTQAQAHGALAHFLRRAQHDGAKFVLVVTGKGARSADQERGVLRRQVPHWLRLPDLREVVLGFEEAHVAHGGEGALYVRLRRMR
jgi:DNA-nicking Smr family endonuclease